MSAGVQALGKTLQSKGGSRKEAETTAAYNRKEAETTAAREFLIEPQALVEPYNPNGGA